MARKTVGVGLLTREVDEAEVFREKLRTLFARARGRDSDWVCARCKSSHPADEARETLAKELRQVLKDAAIGTWVEKVGDLNLVIASEKGTAQLDETRTNSAAVIRLETPKHDLLILDWQSFPGIAELREDSLEWLAVTWLQEYNRLRLAQRQLAAGHIGAPSLSDLVQHAETLGRLEERIWWRTTPVPGSETQSSPSGIPPEKLALDHLPLLGRNRGQQSRTSDRRDFLRQVSADGSNWTHEAIAAEATIKHSEQVLELWGCTGEAARKKIVTFLRNHGLN